MKRRILNVKLILSSTIVLGCIVSGLALAEGGSTGGLSDIAKSVTTSLKDFARLVTAVSYLAGLAFAITAILQFKAYKDNPGPSNPISKPIITLFVAVGLLFLPAVFSRAGATLFGGGATSEAGTISGITGLGK